MLLGTTGVGWITFARAIAEMAAVDCAIPVFPPALARTLDQVAATKTLRIGFVADQAPFSSKGGDGSPVGYVIDLCGKVADEIGKSIADLRSTYVETTMAEAFKLPWQRTGSIFSAVPSQSRLAAATAPIFRNRSFSPE
jgi:ABC-type amino acid transport substrate-binding protein